MTKESSKKRSALARRVRLTVLGAMALAALAIAPSSASADVDWWTETTWAPTPLLEGSEGSMKVTTYNRGSSASTFGSGGQVIVELPPGVTFNGKHGSEFGFICSGSGTSTATCETPSPRPGYSQGSIFLGYDVAPGTSGPAPYTVTMQGGGATSPWVESGTLTIANKLQGFGFIPGSVLAGSYNEDDSDFTQAGGHPFIARGKFDVSLAVEEAVSEFGTPPMKFASAEGIPRDLVTQLPPGFVGNPTAVPRCTHEQFPLDCPPSSQIGKIRTLWGNNTLQPLYAVYNMVPPGDLPAQFAFKIDGYKITGNPSIQSDGDYGIILKFKHLPEVFQPLRIRFDFFGEPADPRNDKQRCFNGNSAADSCNGFNALSGAPGPPLGGLNGSHPYSGPNVPFLSNPTNCADPQRTLFHTTQWRDPAPNEDFSDPRWRHMRIDHPDITGCENLPFAPTIDFETTEKQADTPTGLDVHLHIPQDGLETPGALATAHLKKTSVTLPQGVAFNSAAANGLEACTPEQIGLVSAPLEVPYRFDAVEPSCPTASKIANAEVTTPLLFDKLQGEVFLASQDRNPFDSTFAIYIVVREPSILVKLPGKVELNQATGQITTTFDENPQLPFSDLKLDFFDGPRSSLATPIACGTYTTRSDFVPWSAKDPRNPAPSEIVVHSDPFSITSAPNGQGCVSDKAQLPLNAGLNAGSSNPIAGAKSPFDIQITRPDGNQELDKLEISPPPGFVASLKGIPYCSEAQIAAAASRESGKDEQAGSSCPAASQVGTTNVGAGAGTNPFYAKGKLYLAGPYKGETLSVVAVTPAVAGPFDLGNVVVRSALKINPLTARITAVTDPLPRTIEGVPLRIKDVRIALDRPNWAINPTNCEALSVDVTAYGVDGAVSKPSNRYQLKDCAKLGFKPRLSIHLKGGTRRGAHPSLVAKLKTRPGDANIARAAVTLPSSAFLDQAHIRTICTRVQYAADQCPKGAIYGYAKAETPLLDDPIQGNVILRSSDNKLPDLVGRLRGVANIEAVGRIDSVKGGIRNTFDVIPDAPFDVFTLRMQGGKKGLVINSKNLCATTNRATVKFTAQNGRRYNYRPKVVADGCKKAKKRRGGKKGAKPKGDRR